MKFKMNETSKKETEKGREEGREEERKGGRKEGREDRKETGKEIKLKYFQFIGEVRPGVSGLMSLVLITKKDVNCKIEEFEYFS